MPQPRPPDVTSLRPRGRGPRVREGRGGGAGDRGQGGAAGEGRRGERKAGRRGWRGREGGRGADGLSHGVGWHDCGAGSVSLLVHWRQKTAHCSSDHTLRSVQEKAHAGFLTSLGCIPWTLSEPHAVHTDTHPATGTSGRTPHGPEAEKRGGSGEEWAWPGRAALGTRGTHLEVPLPAMWTGPGNARGDHRGGWDPSAPPGRHGRCALSQPAPWLGPRQGHTLGQPLPPTASPHH